MEPSKQALTFPATTVAAQRAAVLGRGSAPVPAMRRDQFHMELFAYPPIQRIAVVGVIAVQSPRYFIEESVLQRGLDERGFIRRSADLMQGDRKTMAVCDWGQREDLIESEGRHIQRMQKTLTEVNIQVANVLSDVSGVTGQPVIQEGGCEQS